MELYQLRQFQAAARHKNFDMIELSKCIYKRGIYARIKQILWYYY